MDVVLQSPYRHFPIAALTALLLATCAFFAYRPNEAEHGWQRIQPGPMHWLMLPLCGLLLAFLLAMFVHSGQPPFEGENILFYALLALAVGGMIWFPFCIRAIRLSDIRWRDHWVAFTNHEGRHVQSMHDIVALKERWDKYIIVGFSDGGTVKVDPYCRGADRLCETIFQHTEIEP